MSAPAATRALAGLHLHSAYRKSEVLADVSLDVRHGEVVVLLGRNGAGKTTTLRTLAGAHPPRAGKVLLEGRDVTRLPAHRRARAGLVLVPQGARAFGALSVEDNLRLVRPGPTASDGRAAWTLERIYELFPKLRILRQSPSGSLSGGERQMLAVGRALRAAPTVVMLDEPSEGLAPIIVQQVMGLLSRLRETGIGVLLAEQNHRAALRIADRCFFIEKGRIAHEAAAEAVRDSDLVARYLGV